MQYYLRITMKPGKSRSKSSLSSSAADKPSKKTKASSSNCNIIIILVALMIVSIVSVAFFTIPDKELKLKITMLKHMFRKQSHHPPALSLRTQPPLLVATRTEVPQTIQIQKSVPEAEEDDTPAPVRINTPPPTKRRRKDEKFDLHFIHIPKCGGTTMTTILRQIECALDPVKNADCCLNPGFCDWHAKRRCAVIQGCINHFPNREYIFENMPSIAVFREPLSR